MGKKYLGRNINMFLVLIIIISVGCLVGMSTYYSFRYQIIGNSHNDLVKDLKNKTTILENTQAELNQLKTTLAQTSTDVQKYDELYSGKVTELSNTQKELTNTKSDLTKSKQELVKITNLLKDEQTRTRALEIEVSNLESDLNAAERIIGKCQDYIDDPADTDAKNDCEDY